MLRYVEGVLERWVNLADIKEDLEGQVVVGDSSKALNRHGGWTLRQEVVSIEDRALRDILNVELSVAVKLLLDRKLAVINDDHLVHVSVEKGVVSLVQELVFVGLLGHHVHCNMDQDFLSDAIYLQVVNLFEHSEQEDLEFVVIAFHDIPNKVLLHDNVVGQELIKVVLFEVGALTVLLGFDGGGAATSEK